MDENQAVTNDVLRAPPQKWNLFLMSCCIVVSLASFTFGYNIGVISLPQPLVTEFYGSSYFPDHFEGLEKHTNDLLNIEKRKEKLLETASQKFNKNISSLEGLGEFINKSKDQLESRNSKLEDHELVNISKKFDQLLFGSAKLVESKKELDVSGSHVIRIGNILWTVTTSIFVIGGTIGALSSKFVAERFGRKNGIIFHYIFSFVGGLLNFIATYISRPEFIIISRFLYGIQGGMACGLIPTYLYEVSPKQLRGSTGVLQQLFLTIGILVSQVLGFRQLLGTDELWPVLLALPVVTSFAGAFLLFTFFPETPSSLLSKFKDVEGAKNSLKKLRKSDNVDDELKTLQNELSKDVRSTKTFSIPDLFRSKELRFPLITGLVIQMVQQFCGINAIFFYSGMIFEAAGISKENIQYAVGLTGVINVAATIVAVPLIEKLGRKPLLIYPMFFMIFDFVLLTILLVFREANSIIPYLSIGCIILFIIAFAIGLGPIPFIYCAEIFPSEARSTAIAICMLTNWMSNLILTMTFIYINEILKDYTFLIFAFAVAFGAFFILKKVPETKGKSPEQILSLLNPNLNLNLNEKTEKTEKI